MSVNSFSRYDTPEILQTVMIGNTYPIVEFVSENLELIKAAGRLLATFSTREEATTVEMNAFQEVIINRFNTLTDLAPVVYKRVADEPAHTGKFLSLDGIWFEIKENQFLSPEMFGAVGVDLISDDHAFENLMLLMISRGGGTMICALERTYYLTKKHEWDPSRTTIMGNSCRYSFAGKTFTDPSLSVEMITNNTFQGQDTWLKSVNHNNNTLIFGSGYVTASAIADAGDVIGKYSEFGKKLTCIPGRLYRIQLQVEYIDTFTVTSNTSRDIGVSFRNLGIGSGGSGGTIRYASNANSEYAKKKWSWDVANTFTDAYLTIQSNTGFKIKSISVKLLPDNTCILVRVPDWGNLRGHNFHSWSNFKIRGRSGQTAFVDAMQFDTPTAGYASRVNMYNIDISDSIGRGMLFQNRAYLMNFYSFRIVCSEACIETLESPADAGENICLIGGNIGGGKIGIKNNGMEINLMGTSIDFSRQFYVGTGRFTIYAGHCETNQKTQAEKDTLANWDDAQFFIDVTGGSFKMYGGYLQINGSTTPIATHWGRVAKSATIDFDMTEVYNMHGTSGAMFTGEGMVTAKFRGGAGKEMEAVLTENPRANRFSDGFNDTAIMDNMWLFAPSAQNQPSRHLIQYTTFKTITAQRTFGQVDILATDTVNVSAGFAVEGEGIVPGTIVLSRVEGVSIKLSIPPMKSVTGPITFKSQFPSANAVLAIDPANGRGGGPSLMFAKSDIGSVSLVAQLAYKIEPNQMTGGQIWLKADAIPGSVSVQDVYVTAAFVRLINSEGNAVPTVGAQKQSLTDQKATINFSTGLDWTKFTWKTSRVDASAEHNGYAPEWATHCMISINAAQLPRNFKINIDDIIGNVY